MSGRLRQPNSHAIAPASARRATRSRVTVDWRIALGDAISARRRRVQQSRTAARSSSEFPKKISPNDSPTIALNAPAPQEPAARARATIRSRSSVDDQNAAPASRRIVERMPCAACAAADGRPRRRALDALERDGFQKPRRHDPVGVDVVAAQRRARAPLDACDADCMAHHACLAPGRDRPHVHDFARDRRGRHHRRAHQQRAARSGLPCRPLKLRFDDDAQTSRPSSRSGFIARHIEQPAPRHSKPASRKTRRDLRVRPPRAPPATRARPARARAAPRGGPPTTCAASRRSESRAVRARADERDVDSACPQSAGPARSPMNSSASATPGAVRRTAAGVGSGASTATDCPGLMPHVTVGAIVAASNRHARRPTPRPRSDAMLRHHAHARSNAAPCGANRRPRRYSNVVSSGLT